MQSMREGKIKEICSSDMNYDFPKDSQFSHDCQMRDQLRLMTGVSKTKEFSFH